MNKQKGILASLSVALIILELLPYGVVLNFANAPEAGGGTYRETYSYFSLLPFGYANFMPFIIALLSCVLMLLVLIFAFSGRTLGAIKVISMIIVVLSLYPIIIGVSYFSVIGIAIAVIAFLEAVWSFAIGQPVKSTTVTSTNSDLSGRV